MPNPLAAYLAEHPGVTHAELALRSGIPLDTLRSYVYGRRRVSLHNAFALERATEGAVQASDWEQSVRRHAQTGGHR